ncbi:MAG: ornithine cyclodeaminase [Chloroflexi bacterium]|nr:ornithine cyclodeaminase [Chloroflexota bacterium]
MTLLLTNADVRGLLTMQMTIDALDRSYRGLATGETVCRPRIESLVPTKRPGHTYLCGTMEGGSSDFGYFAIRLQSSILYHSSYAGVRTEEKFASRPGLFCGLTILFDVENAEPVAIMHDGYLQGLRVGASVAIGARYIAREDAHVLGVFGAGAMARSHLEALRYVRPIDRVQVFSPTREHREAYAREMADKYKVEAVALDEPSAVCRGADIVCECTDAVEPVVFGQWLEPGTHLTYVGRNRLDSEAYNRVDVSLRLTTASSPIGHPEWATDLWTMTYAARRSVDDDTPPAVRRGEGRFKRVISLEDMVSGREQGRSSREQITNATRGNVQGAEFFAIAGVVYEAARAAGVGRELPTEWFLDDVRD